MVVGSELPLLCSENNRKPEQLREIVDSHTWHEELDPILFKLLHTTTVIKFSPLLLL
jgi:hypothetical protein